MPVKKIKTKKITGTGGGPTELEKDKQYRWRPYFRVSLRERPDLAKLDVGGLYNARTILKVAELSEMDVCFEIIDLAVEGKRRKTKEEIEKNSQGSYRWRDD